MHFLDSRWRWWKISLWLIHMVFMIWFFRHLWGNFLSYFVGYQGSHWRFTIGDQEQTWSSRIDARQGKKRLSTLSRLGHSCLWDPSDKKFFQNRSRPCFYINRSNIKVLEENCQRRSRKNFFFHFCTLFFSRLIFLDLVKSAKVKVRSLSLKKVFLVQVVRKKEEETNSMHNVLAVKRGENSKFRNASRMEKKVFLCVGCEQNSKQGVLCPRQGFLRGPSLNWQVKIGGRSGSVHFAEKK